MKKSKFFLILLALVALMFFGCQKGQALLKTDEVKNLREDMNNGIIGFEWLCDYDKKKPSVFIFHGEVDSDERFTVNLDKSVYCDDITYASPAVNADKLGWKGQGLKDARDGASYDMERYWLEVGGFNVAVLHAEAFLCEGTENSATKIYSVYKSRFISDGKTVDRGYGYSLAQIVSAIYIEELISIGIGNREIRFIGYGVGANLALACSDYLYTYGDKGANYLPDRITMCDPYLSDKETGYSTAYGNFPTENGTLGIVKRMSDNIPKSAIIEIIETEEVSDNSRTRAYPAVSNTKLYGELLDNAVSLIYSEHYSLATCYANYKAKKRIAFDWYIYSVIGSDDSESYSSVTQKYAVGYPHNYSEVDTATKSNVNWGRNKTRPMLNYRRLTNDARNDAGSNYGKNFSVSAWTPTEYLMGLRGVRFVQKEGSGTSSGATDKHGNFEYELTDYVMATFRSENYQYSKLNETTVLTGTVYVDDDADGLMNDGKFGVKATIYVKVLDSSGKVICDKTKTATDEYGRYTLRIHDYKEGDVGLTFAPADGGGDIYGFNARNSELTVEVSLYTPKGYTSRTNTSTAIYWYDAIRMNAAKNGVLSIGVSKYNVYSVSVGNIFVVKAVK